MKFYLLCPEEIPDGNINGIRARGGFELKYAWSSGELRSVEVISNSGFPLKINYRDKSFLLQPEKVKCFNLTETLMPFEYFKSGTEKQNPDN